MSAASLVTSLLAQWLAFAAIMAGAWIVQQRTRNSGWVDVSWTFGIGCVAAVAALIPLDAEPISARQFLVAILVGIWALRLGGQLAVRTAAMDDDPRYAELARKWGEGAPRRMFGFLQMQVLVSLPLLLTILVAAHRPGESLLLSDFLGAAILAIAIGGEAISDRQLMAFRKDPKNAGRVCDAGLWRWSRHPNYFFQWFGWLAYPVIAIDLTGVYLWGWLALLGPLTMYVLLVRVSGIPPLEAHMVRSRGEAYRAYQARTSAFFPRPPITSS